MSRLRSSIAANPSGYAAKIFKTVTWKFTSAYPPSAPHGRRVRKGLATALSEVFGRKFAAISGLQDPRCHMRTRPNLALRIIANISRAAIQKC